MASHQEEAGPELNGMQKSPFEEGIAYLKSATYWSVCKKRGTLWDMLERNQSRTLPQKVDCQ